LGAIGPSGTVGGCHDVVQNNLHRDWFDTVRWWVSPGIGLELALEAEIYFAQRVAAEVRGPQAGVHLAHGT
jgi:hypothetical protein